MSRSMGLCVFFPEGEVDPAAAAELIRRVGESFGYPPPIEKPTQSGARLFLSLDRWFRSGATASLDRRDGFDELRVLWSSNAMYRGTEKEIRTIAETLRALMIEVLETLAPSFGYLTRTEEFALDEAWIEKLALRPLRSGDWRGYKPSGVEFVLYPPEVPLELPREAVVLHDSRAGKVVRLTNQVEWVTDHPGGDGLSPSMGLCAVFPEGERSRSEIARVVAEATGCPSPAPLAGEREASLDLSGWLPRGRARLFHDPVGFDVLQVLWSSWALVESDDRPKEQVKKNAASIQALLVEVLDRLGPTFGYLTRYEQQLHDVDHLEMHVLLPILSEHWQKLPDDLYDFVLAAPEATFDLPPRAEVIHESGAGRVIRLSVE